MAGCSPAQPGRRRHARGWSTPSKASSRRPKSPTPSSAPPAAQLPPLSPGTEVEVRVDDDGFHGSWFEATVDGFIPARGRGSRARYTVTYAHLLSDDSGATLVEPFAPSRIRPRPPAPSSPEPLALHDIVEAFHNDGWWSGIVLATDPLTVAFPITREVITFQEPRHVRPRRDYVDGRWVSSRAAIAVQPKRAVRVYEVGDKVEVVRDREVYGRSWFPATVAKVIDGLSYLVEYFDLEVEGAEGKAMEYLHCLFIRPAVEHSPRESEFRLGPGAAVEAYCDGAWSPGVVRRVVGDGEYEVSIDGKEAELLLNKVPELLKPQYKWDGKHWRIVSPKRQGNRRQSVSGKRPSSPVEVASSDDEHRHNTESSARKRSRKEPLQKKLHMLTEDSEHALEPEMNTTLSALRKSLASNHSPKSCSPLSGKNNFQVLSQRVVSSCAVSKKGCGLLHASSEHPSPQKESRADSTGEVVNQEVLSDMMLSDGQLNTPVNGTSADEAHDILLTAGLKHKMDSSCINNSAQQTQQRPLFVQALQVKKHTFKHKGGEMHPIQALEGNSDASDNVQIQLKGNNNISSKEIICALSAYTCNTPSLLDKRIRAPDAVSRGAGSGPNTEVLTSKNSAKNKGFKDSSSPHASLDATSIVQKIDRKKVAGRLKESFVERLLERRGLHTQQQLIRNLEDTMNVNRGTNQEVLPLISPGFEDSSSPHASLDATSTVQKRGRKKVAGRLKESSVESLLERRELDTQQQLNRNLEDTMNVNGGTNQEVLPLVSPGFKDSSSPHASLDATSTVQKRGRKKVAGRPKESSVKSLLERRGLHTQLQLNRNLEDTMNVNRGTNQEVLPLISPSFKDSSSPHASLDATSTVQKRGRKKVAGRLKESSVKRLLERRELDTQQQLNRSLEDTMDVNRGTNQEVLPLISPGFESICNGQGFLDGGKVDERPIQQDFQNAGSSQCTIDDTILRSCSVAGSSLPSTLPSCQNLAEQVLFMKTSPVWHLIETMKVFREVPQQPHFLPLQQFMPELREGMALGLMVTYANLVESVKKSCISDSVALFERKISALAHLEDNGFDVKFLQHSLNKLLQTKCDHTKHLGHVDQLKELVPGKESAVSRKHALLDEKDKAIFQLEQELECLRGEAEQIARETKDEDAELSRLKAEVNIAQEACGDDELRFHSILAELRSRLQLSD